MGKKSPKAPAAPDPAATAAAQALANKEAVFESARVNQINEVTPFGELRYTGEIGEPDRTRTTTLNPQSQAIFDLEQGISQGLAGLGANAIMPNVTNAVSNPFSLSGLPPPPVANENERMRIETALMDRLDPQFARDEERLNTRLNAQGLQQGTEAYSNAYDDFNRAKTDARLAATQYAGQEYARDFGLASQSRDRAVSELMMQRNQPINELAALLQGSPATPMPQFGQTAQLGVQPADITGPTALQYQGQLNAYNQALGQQNAMMGGLFGLGAAAIPLIPSDRRLKRGIKLIGKLGKLGIYAYRYVWGGPEQVGLMADEVRRVKPHAVVRVGGYDMVNYKEALS